jgi:predicted P-loop ATPase
VERTAITGEAPEVDEGPVHQQLVDEGPIDQVETPERGPLDGLAARLADGAEHAFDAEVVRAAAELADASPAFQAVLATLAAAKVRIRDWRAAVGQVRDHLKRADEEEHQRRREAEIATDETEMAIAMLRKGLLRDEWDEPRKNLANLIAIFARDPRWSGALAYHVLREGVVITAAPPWNDDERGAPSSGDWTEQASTCATSWLSRAWGIDVASKLVEEAIEAVARRTVLDPLGTYLRGVTWDGTPRIDTWLSAFCRVDDTTYSRAVGARWLISAVARALRPGCQVDCVLILEGLQGKGKSSALRALCPDESLFFDDKLDIGSKDAAQSLRGKWLIELGELSALSRSELSDQKSFITRRVDSYRPSFGRRARDFARRCVFAGSTNEESYLRDEENRRYWPVLCKLGKGGGETIDFEGLAAVRDQLWAEAVDRYRAGERWYADTPELVALCQEQQELRAQADPWEQWIGDWLDVQLKKCEARLLAERCDCVRCRGVTTGAILSGALALEKGRQTRAEEMRAAAVLRRLGWIKGTLASRAGSRVRPYFPALTTSEVVQEVVQ